VRGGVKKEHKDGDKTSSDYIVNEDKFEKKVLGYLQKQYGDRAKSHPFGKQNVDIGIFRHSADKILPKNIEIFVEVKGTTNKDGVKFEQKQNKHHLAYGLFQLMTRIRTPGQRGILFLPYHQDFEGLLDESCLTIKRTGLEIIICHGDDGPYVHWK
jgi:hypothetical protein